MTPRLASMMIALAVLLTAVPVAGQFPPYARRVTHTPHEKVLEAVTRGQTPGQSPIELIPRDMDLGIRVNVGRKSAGAQAEIHSIYGHIFFIQEGSGTLVLGGELVDPVEHRPGEWFGARSTGGQEFKVTKGDLITVEVGMAHWWKELPPEGIVFIAFHSYPEHNQPGAGSGR